MSYGRMNATLGVELKRTNSNIQTTIPLGYIDPVTEVLDDSLTPMTPRAGDGTQLWKITHNGVDTHFIHFHLFNVQLINRVGWDGNVRPPDPNELGWKETVRMNPLEDAIVALRPVAPKLPFGVPDSIRPMDVTRPLGSTMGFFGVDPNGNPVTVVNALVNFGWEYVWHCHILGHEENDMMRPIVFNGNARVVVPAKPTLAGNTTGSTAVAPQVNLSWTDALPPIPANWGNPAMQIGFKIERAIIFNPAAPPANPTYVLVGTALAHQTTFTDLTVGSNVTYFYRVTAYNSAGGTASNVVSVRTPVGTKPASPSDLTSALHGTLAAPTVTLAWRDNSINETGFVLERSSDGGATFPVTFNIPAKAGANTSVSFVDATVALGTTYTYQVKAVNGAVSSAYSNQVSVIVAVPAAPSGLTATQPGAAGTPVILQWTDNALNEVRFTVQRSTLPTGPWLTLTLTVPASPGKGGFVTYSDTRARPLTLYYYRVMAAGVLGTSAPSLPASITTQ
jgi:hypothetical protein